MVLSNTATPKYYKAFRDQVLRGEIPVNREISMEMNRIENLIADKRYYYDDRAIDGYIAFCEKAKLDHNLLIVPGTGFGCPGHARISYCVPTEQVERSLAAFEKLVKSYK